MVSSTKNAKKQWDPEVTCFIPNSNGFEVPFSTERIPCKNAWFVCSVDNVEH